MLVRHYKVAELQEHQKLALSFVDQIPELSNDEIYLCAEKARISFQQIRQNNVTTLLPKQQRSDEEHFGRHNNNNLQRKEVSAQV